MQLVHVFTYETGVNRMIPFEERNVEAYRKLLQIEICLRELTKKILADIGGQTWHKAIPGKLLSKVRDSQRDEEKPHFDFLCMGPLYYLTLGELHELLNQGNGKKVIEQLGGKQILDQLGLLLGPRNAVSHNRDVGEIGLLTINTTHKMLIASLTQEQFELLLSTPDTGVLPKNAISEFRTWAVKLKKDIDSYPRTLALPNIYKHISNQYWWGSKELAGFDCDVIVRAVILVKQYNQLPQGVGSLEVRRAYAKKVNAIPLIDGVLAELKDK